MSMTRKTRIWLIVLAIPLVVIVAGIIVLKSLFTSEKLKSMVIPRVEAATHRQVTMNDISLAVFPSIGVQIDGFTMTNRKGSGFSSAPFVTLEGMKINVKLIPLFKGQVEVTSVTFDKPRILIETNRKGETNYADLSNAPATPASGQGEAATSTAGNTMAFLVSDFRVNDGAIDLFSYKDNSATRIRGLNLESGAEGSGSRITIAGNVTIDSLSYGTLESNLISDLRVGFEHKLTYDMATDSLTLEQGNFSLQDMHMTITGGVSGVQKKMALNLAVGSDNLNIAELLSLVPKEYMKKAEGLKGNGLAQVHLRITGSVSDSTTADVSGKISATGASIQYPKLPKPISNINIASSFVRSKTRQEFRIDKLTANLGDNPMSMTLAVTNFEDPSLALTADGSLNLSEVGQFYPLEQGTELGGKMTLNVQLAGKVKDPSAMKASGTMAFQDVSVKTAASKNPVQHLQGSITFNNQTVEAKGLSMNVGRSDMTMGFLLKNYLSLMSTDKAAPPPTATMTLQSRHIYTEDIMGDENSAGGKPPEANKQGTAGQTKKKTSLPFPNLTMDVSASMGTLTMTKFEFTNVKAAMHIANGIITISNISLNTFGGTAVSKGVINLQNPDRPTFDMGLDLNGLDANPMLSQFTSFGQRISGKLTMNTTMKGALDDTMGLVPNALDGGGKVNIQNGSLKGYKVNQSLASALSLPSLDTINFKDWTNAFTVANGRLQVKDLKITALNADYVVNGSQGLDGSLDYSMSLYLPENTSSRIKVAGFAGDAVNLFKDPSGRLKLDFSVGGTTNDPKVSLDTGPAKQRAEDMAKQKLQQEATKAGDKLKDKATDALQNLFKRKK